MGSRRHVPHSSMSKEACLVTAAGSSDHRPRCGDPSQPPRAAASPRQCVSITGARPQVLSHPPSTLSISNCGPKFPFPYQKRLFSAEAARPANKTSRWDPRFRNTTPSLETQYNESLRFNSISSWADGRNPCESPTAELGRSPHAMFQPPTQISHLF